MPEFSLQWRFTAERSDLLANALEDQLKPLDNFAANFLMDYISKAGLHDDCPFREGVFNVLESIIINDDNSNEIKSWLLKRGVTKNREVYLSWDSKTAMIVPFYLLAEYFDDFAYPSSDDLIVFDESLNWALIFFHYGDIHFGSNEKFGK